MQCCVLLVSRNDCIMPLHNKIITVPPQETHTAAQHTESASVGEHYSSKKMPESAAGANPKGIWGEPGARPPRQKKCLTWKHNAGVPRT